jgi:cardiolipin synthase (CMP-forming)
VNDRSSLFDHGSGASFAEETTDRFFTISNVLSISRAVLAIPFAVVMLSDSSNATLWGMIILFVAALTDKFDGVLARKLNQVTDWGKILDPLADKIGMSIVAITLVMLNLIPLWFVVAMIARDVMILAGGIYVRRKKGVVLQSNQLGKWTIGVVALAMFFAMIRWTVAAEIFLWTTVAMLVASLAIYLRRFVEVMQR